MKNGDKVRVYPHGTPDQAATGIVKLISGNQRSIAVAFDDLPPFAFEKMPVIGIHPEHGVMLLAMRLEVGPWIELSGGGHYEIDESA